MLESEYASCTYLRVARGVTSVVVLSGSIQWTDDGICIAVSGSFTAPSTTSLPLFFVGHGMQQQVII